MAKPMPSVEVLLVGLLVLKRREPWLLILAFKKICWNWFGIGWSPSWQMRCIYRCYIEMDESMYRVTNHLLPMWALLGWGTLSGKKFRLYWVKKIQLSTQLKLVFYWGYLYNQDLPDLKTLATLQNPRNKTHKIC
jgi:hypothetical protein